jgi:hypothetical protein
MIGTGRHNLSRKSGYHLRFPNSPLGYFLNQDGITIPSTKKSAQTTVFIAFFSLTTISTAKSGFNKMHPLTKNSW